MNEETSKDILWKHHVEGRISDISFELQDLNDTLRILLPDEWPAHDSCCLLMSQLRVVRLEIKNLATILSTRREKLKQLINQEKFITQE